MSRNTKIQWCHGTVNPVMGCDGCELYPTLSNIRNTIHKIINPVTPAAPSVVELIHSLTESGPQVVKLNLEKIAEKISLAATLGANGQNPTLLAAEIEKRVSQLYICYAATLHRAFNSSGGNSGYAFPFEAPRLYQGRVAAAAKWSKPSAKDVAEKPWLVGYRRLIFVSDMGDALSADISFDFLHKEIIQPVSSAAGQEHLWLWLSKRPRRMAELSNWLKGQGIEWPENLVAMTSVTGPENVNRISQLLKVGARYKALSVEPLRAEVNLPLDGIDWAIVGGESGKHAKPFHVEWAERIRNDCALHGTACFLKQWGSNPFHRQQPVAFKDSHGGDWSEWPENFRIRELPRAWMA